MIDDERPNPNIPSAYKVFFDAVEAGNARSFGDFFSSEQGRDYLEDLADRMTDFYEVELIVEGVAQANENLAADLYVNELKHALLDIWPPAAPDIVNQLRKEFGKERQGIEKTGTWSDYQIAIGVMPQDVRDAYVELSQTDMSKINNVLGSAGLSPDDNTPGKASEVKKKIGEAKSKFFRALRDAWPGKAKPKQKKLPAERTDEATERMENHFVYQAVCDLLNGDFIDLDPVIGDEACEARPSALIDIWESVKKAYDQELGFVDKQNPSSVDNQNLNSVDKAKFGYCLRHKKDTLPTRLKDVSQIQDESAWSNEFITWCNDVLGNIGPWAGDYLKWCKANTLASTMACDEWGIVSYDRNKGVYETVERAHKRAELSTRSIAWIRDMAQALSGGDISEHGKAFWQQVAAVLNGADARKNDNGIDVFALPIYEMMRTVLAYESHKGRPVILSLYRIKYDANEGYPYSLTAVHTLVYDLQTGTWSTADHSNVDPHRPRVCFQAFQLVSAGDPIPVGDGANFFANDGDDYLNGFMACSFALQTMIYSAVHPPVPHDGTLNGNPVADDGGRAVLQQLQAGAVADSWGQDLAFDRTSAFSLFDPVCDLATEYQKLLDLGRNCNLHNKQYMTRPGGGQVCERTTDSCAFTIHHINTRSLAQVQARDNAAQNTGSLKRYHHFDKGESYGTLEEAQAQ